MAEVGECKTFMKHFKIPSKPTCEYFVWISIHARSITGYGKPFLTTLQSFLGNSCKNYPPCTRLPNTDLEDGISIMVWIKIARRTTGAKDHIFLTQTYRGGAIWPPQCIWLLLPLKFDFFITFFIGLIWSLAIFWQSQEVKALNFEHTEV